MYSYDIETFLNGIRDKRSALHGAVKTLQQCDDKTQDLLHKLELEVLTYHEKASIAKEIEMIRKERRRAKDTIELLTPVAEFADNNKKCFDQLAQLLGAVRKIELRQGTRTYTPKIKEL